MFSSRLQPRILVFFVAGLLIDGHELAVGASSAVGKQHRKGDLRALFMIRPISSNRFSSTVSESYRYQGNGSLYIQAT